MDDYLKCIGNYVKIKSTVENNETVKDIDYSLWQFECCNVLPKARCQCFLWFHPSGVKQQNKTYNFPAINQNYRRSAKQQQSGHKAFKKSIMLNFSTKNIIGSIKIATSTKFETSNSTKLLGIAIDNHQSCKNHTDNLTQKLLTCFIIRAKKN